MPQEVFERAQLIALGEDPRGKKKKRAPVTPGPLQRARPLRHAVETWWAPPCSPSRRNYIEWGRRGRRIGDACLTGEPYPVRGVGHQRVRPFIMIMSNANLAWAAFAGRSNFWVRPYNMFHHPGNRNGRHPAAVPAIGLGVQQHPRVAGRVRTVIGRQPFPARSGSKPPSDTEVATTTSYRLLGSTAVGGPNGILVQHPRGRRGPRATTWTSAWKDWFQKQPRRTIPQGEMAPALGRLFVEDFQ